MIGNQAKIISLVPSWTETLLASGVTVAGRTRFCIHPEQIVNGIASVGGTKSIDIKKIKEINPDYVLLDRQENTKEMAEQILAAGIKLLITDVTDFQSLLQGLRYLAETLKNEKLSSFADRYEAIVSGAKVIDRNLFFANSILKGTFVEEKKLSSYAYVIWKNPFMVVGDDTFIAANFKLIGIDFNLSEKYPQISEAELKNKFCFFSSEPFPFFKDYDSLIQNGFSGLVVDGEKISWFGIRNLLFLEACLK